MTLYNIFSDEGDLEPDVPEQEEPTNVLSQDTPKQIVLPQAEIYLEIREGFPWDDGKCVFVSD